MRILLVEDHVELSHWVSKALRDANLTVECAATGADADALLHTQDYALVILDLTLPRWTAWTCCAACARAAARAARRRC
jgi:two-component system response regulator TctD